MSPHSESRNSRLPLALIVGTPLIMLLAASWLWYFVVHGNLDLVGAIGAANNGALVTPPRQIRNTPLRDDAGASVDWADLDPRWTMVMVNRGPVCDDYCRHRLYVTRQIHIALGKEFNRVRRVLVGDVAVAGITLVDEEGSNDLLTFLNENDRGLIPFALEPALLESSFPEITTQPHQWFLVDPAGWIMMRFEDDLDFKAVISDLKFLLKNSGA